MRSRPGLVGREVATKKWRCDLAGLSTGDLASRPRFLGSDKGVL